MTNTTAAAAPRQPKARKPRQKPERFARIAAHPETLTCSLVIRTVARPSGKESVDRYALEEIGTDTVGARGFSLTKEDGTVYNVELDGGWKSCDCKGHANHRHCKHADALAALIHRGRL
jgi:hypothetical protein